MNELTFRVLTACRGELMGLYPALATAFGYLPWETGASFGTDGQKLSVPDAICKLYAQDPAQVRRGYLHTLLHCLYLQIRLPEKVDPKDWGLACDIYVETFLDHLEQPRLGAPSPEKLQMEAALSGTPWQILEKLGTCPWTREELDRCFRADDHSLWSKKLPPETESRWMGLSSGGCGTGLGNRGSVSFGLEEEIRPDTRKRDLRRYLSRFTKQGEVLEADPESFDYIFYHLGMEHYGNLPLLEPLEYREVWRMDTLAIAIDTSGSCDKETVKAFLGQVYEILSNRENFFQRMQVVFFQCDCCLQDTTFIHSVDEWMHYRERLKIIGRGGTDYTPVFREIQRLREEKRFPKPRALLYFTDGDGVYPQKPDYETAFLLAGPQKNRELVPKWATVLELEEEPCT